MDYSIFIKDKLLEASKIANDNFGKVSGTVKPDDNNQVLTSTDIEIGKYLVNAVKQEFQSHNIIDEEAGVVDNQSEYTWVIDPIDGTSNFANGLPMYGITIGLLKNANSIAGGIMLPAFNELYIAEKDKGAFLNGEKISVSSENTLLNCLVAYGIDGHQENPELTMDETKILASIVLNIRNLRTSNSVFDVAMVAKGRYAAFLNKTSKIWDNVAQQIIIEEAGGVYTDFYGKPMDYSKPLEKVTKNFTFCASTLVLHKSLQEIIHAVQK